LPLKSAKKLLSLQYGKKGKKGEGTYISETLIAGDQQEYLLYEPT